jgi:hypothetical protein
MRVDSQDPFRSETDYTDLASSRVVSATRDAHGVMQSVTIGPLFDPARRLPPTGRRDRVLGESCSIWRVTRERLGSQSEICETADGILLREAFWYSPGNRTVTYMAATAIERRPVRADEVLPPRDLLALARDGPAPAAISTNTPTGPGDYEVEMVGDAPADGRYVLRRHAGFSSREIWDRDEHSLAVDNGAVSISYSETAARRPLSMQITRAAYGPRLGRVFQWENVPGRAPEHLLGETCVWQENVAIRGTDQHYECRTADGVPLKTQTNFEWTGLQRFTARRLSRRPLRDADFAPSARALDWATWGITPAP